MRVVPTLKARAINLSVIKPSTYCDDAPTITPSCISVPILAIAARIYVHIAIILMVDSPPLLDW